MNRFIDTIPAGMLQLGSCSPRFSILQPYGASIVCCSSERVKDIRSLIAISLFNRVSGEISRKVFDEVFAVVVFPVNSNRLRNSVERMCFICFVSQM